MFVLHILAVFGTPIPHPLTLALGHDSFLGHRIIEQEEPLLAHGQQFVPGLTVDASFEQGGGLFLEVANVVCKSGVVEVYFRWPTTRPSHEVGSLLDRFHYQVVDRPEAIRPMLPKFFPGLHA